MREAGYSMMIGIYGPAGISSSIENQVSSINRYRQPTAGFDKITFENGGLNYSSIDSAGAFFGVERLLLRGGFRFLLGGSFLGSDVGANLGSGFGSSFGSGSGSGPKPKNAPGKCDDFGFWLGFRCSRHLLSLPRVRGWGDLFGWGFLRVFSGLERSSTNQSSPGHTTGILYPSICSTGSR